MLHLGHYCREKMLLWAWEAVYLPGITNDIKTTIATCKICAMHNKSQKKGTLLPYEVPMCLWEQLRVDLFEFNRVHYLLVVEYYSQIPVLRVLHTLTATAVIRHLKKIFLEYGVWKTLLSDGSPQFECQEFRNFAKQWCFTHTLSSLRHPWSNWPSWTICPDC